MSLKKNALLIALLSLMLFFYGCAAVEFAKKTVVATGSVVVAAAKTTGKVAMVTGQAVMETGHVLKTLIDIPFGRSVVPLEQQGNSLFVNVTLNRNVKAKLLLDTGCTDTQISPLIAAELKIRETEGERVTCHLAGGNAVPGRMVNIKEIKLGNAKIRNVPAVILDSDRTRRHDGLLGMAFLNNFSFKVDIDKNELILQKRQAP